LPAVISAARRLCLFIVGNKAGHLAKFSEMINYCGNWPMADCYFEL